MARASAQPAQTPQRRVGGYIRDVPDRMPRARTRTSQPEPEDIELPESQAQEEEEEEIEIRERRPGGHLPEAPLTKSGRPDRRFLGARHLPPPEEPENPDYRRARTGGMMGDIHVTIDGKPDRRFKENRGLSDEEVMHQWVDVLNNRYRRH